MENRGQYKRIIVFTLSIVIITLQTIVFWYIWHQYYSKIIPLPYWRRGNWAVVGLYAIQLLFFSKIYGGLKIGYLRITDVIYSQVLTIIFVNIITYLQICLIGRWFMYPVPMLMMTLSDIIVIVVWAFISKWVYMRLYPPRKMIMVYGDRAPDDLIKKMSTRKDKYEIASSIYIGKGEEAIKEAIVNYEAVIICDIPSHIRNVILKFCFEKSIRVYITPKISDIIIMGSDNIHLFDTPLLLSRNQGLSFEQKVVKRAIDFVFALISLIVASPLMLLIAIWIKLYDGGPIFYRQVRLTIDGKKFNIYKFRSMRVDSEKDQVARLAKKNDDRVTPLGKVLRNLHFDEIPQLFNILNGDMSLVGPRPERPSIAEEYRDSIPEFNFRLKVKAGLTGYAQIYGKYNTTPYDKLKLDLFYIENYSFLLDFKLMLMTVKILFQKENTEGVEEWQTTAFKNMDNGDGK